MRDLYNKKHTVVRYTKVTELSVKPTRYLIIELSTNCGSLKKPLVFGGNPDHGMLGGRV